MDVLFGKKYTDDKAGAEGRRMTGHDEYERTAAQENPHCENKTYCYPIQPGSERRLKATGDDITRLAAASMPIKGTGPPDRPSWAQDGRRCVHVGGVG